MNILSKTTTLSLLLLFFQTTQAIIFNITNNCPYTIWPAAVPGGGRRLDPGQNWIIFFHDGPRSAKIWARTNCTFDSSGRGHCLTGDCDGQLACGSYEEVSGLVHVPGGRPDQHVYLPGWDEL
ncbi:Osmotin-like protein OSM34 [Striga hermonthica]|uniref:Osmotin-like protein OSM34 n=1 Tax=Striga hermonthica TaxID=68872 RepID=A0A9N7RTW5_STRHE|nr:Osmotin-like protein OSM34 [Striga hermonthica]